MKCFNLYLILYLLLIVGSAVLLGVAIQADAPKWVSLLVVISVLLGLTGVWRIVLALKHWIHAFVKSLEMNDSTMQFPKSHDREINAISEGMNRIAELYREGRHALEIRKLYYDRILRVMTHELRNGVTPIVSLSKDIERHPEKYGAEKLREAMSVIHTESMDIKRFLDSYYKLTHLPNPDMQEVDAKDFFSKIAKSFAWEIKEAGLSDEMLTFLIAEDMRLYIDPDLMKLVICNLLKNALQALKDKDKPQIVVTVSLPAGETHITVMDNGAGMSPETLSNLFQPFFATKPDGNGIGLCLSRQIVKLHGGKITVNSTISKGTTFSISLPLKSGGRPI